MSDVALIVYGTISAIVLIFVSYIWFVVRRSQQNEQDRLNHTPQASGSRILDNDENVMRVGNRVIHNRHSRGVRNVRRRDAGPQQEQAIQQAHDEDSDDLEGNLNQANESDSEVDISDAEPDDEPRELPHETVMPKGKVGKKKLLKLEMKEERKRFREQELREREERRKKEEQEYELRKKKEEEEERKEREREEAEKKAKEEQAKREYEEYLKLKQSFQIEQDGFDANVDESDNENKLIEFIETIRNRKIVLLEELAAEFNMKTQEVIDRIHNLLDTDQLTGVIDDRGKFIYITPEELNAVAKFIKQRGRVSIAQLVENSNKLIKL